MIIKTKEIDGVTYELRKYELTDDMSSPEVQQSRGIIRNLTTGEIVCRGFDKFFNRGEPYAADIDWSSAIVWEKIDGTNIRFAYWGGKWRVSTLGMPDIMDITVDPDNTDFGALVLTAMEVPMDIFTKNMDKNCTYIFELTSEENHLVINYPATPRLWWLSRRNNISGQEDYILPDDLTALVGFPRKFPLTSPEAIVEYFNTVENLEGVVVQDANYHRIKMKTDAYLEAFHTASIGCGKLTNKRLLTMLREGIIDDIAPIRPNEVQDFMQHYHNLQDKLLQAYEVAERNHWTRVEVGQKGAKPYRAWIWYKMSHPAATPAEFLDQCARSTVVGLMSEASPE